MGEDEEADCPNNARLFRIAVSNSLKNIAESVRKVFFAWLHQLTFEEFHEAFEETKASMVTGVEAVVIRVLRVAGIVHARTSLDYCKYVALISNCTSPGLIENARNNVAALTYYTLYEDLGENEFLEILTILKSNPNIAQKLHKAMIKELYSSMNNDLEDVLKEGSLQESFTKIAKLSEENTSTNEHAWRPPGDVTSHLRSLDAHMIKEATKELEEQVNEMERENETLMRTIAESRLRIRATNDNVMRILNCAPDVLQRLEKTCEQLTTCLKTIENE